MLEPLVSALADIPPWLATIVLAMLPLGELRGALPVALVVYQLPLPLAVLWSIVGNLLPVWFLLVLFERVATWLRQRSELADRFFTWLFERTRRKLEAQVERYGVWALALFVAIPLPVTGAWTGTVAAFVFGLDKKKAFGAIAVGLCVAAAIVTILTLGTTTTVNFFIGR